MHFWNLIKERLSIEIACAIYILFFASKVSEIIDTTIYGWGDAAGAIVLGAAIIIMNVLEVFAVSPYLNAILREIEDEKKRSKILVPLILMLFLHAAIAIISIIVAFQVVGIDWNKNAIYAIIVIGILLIKEIYFIKNIFSNNPVVPFSPNLSQVIIALYSCLMFTIFWDANKGEVSADNTPLMLFELIPMALFYAFFYYPLRLPFVLRRFIDKQTTQDRLLAFVFFLIAFIPAAVNKLGM